MKINTAVLKIFRGQSKDQNSFDLFKVPFVNGDSVLDALIWIRDNVDEGLSFRYSCINANACKECMIFINGEIKYSCTTKLTKNKIVLEPLPNKNLIIDLVTDIVPPKEKIWFVPLVYLLTLL